MYAWAAGEGERARSHTQVEWQFFGAAPLEKMLPSKIFPVRKHTATHHLAPWGAFVSLYCGSNMRRGRERCEQVGSGDCSINQLSRYLREFRVLIRISELSVGISRISAAARNNRHTRQAIILGQGGSPRIIKSNKKAWEKNSRPEIAKYLWGESAEIFFWFRIFAA